MEQRVQPFDISSARDILTILFKHKYKILVTFLVISIGVTIFAFYSTGAKTYESKSVILVKFGREFMTRPEEGRTGQVIPQQAIIAGEITILTSRDLLTRVVKQIGPETIYPWVKNAENLSPLYAAVNTFEQNLSVERIGGSNMIQITFVHPDPMMAATSLNTLVDLFKEKHIEVLSGEGSAFLENQREISRGKLRESERKLADYRQRYGVFSLEDQRQSLIDRRANLDTSLKTVQNEINALQQKIVFIKGSGWKTESNRDVKSSLLALERKEKEMLLKYKENNVLVQNVRAEIQASVEEMKRSAEEARQVELSKAEGELTVARAKYDGLRQQLSRFDEAMLSIEARSRDFAELKREVTSQEQSYQAYTKKLEDAQAGEEMDRHTMVAISVAEKAIPSSVPKQGRFGKKQLIPMGFFGGIAGGIALAFLIEFMAPGMATPYSAERRLGVPVMVAVTKK
jgi:uncharacterized protein involved in exopolysaccharide biosynthesis